MVRFWADPVAQERVARLILRLVARGANGPQDDGYKGSSNQTRTARNGIAEMPPLPEDAIDASLRRRDRQRRNDHWTGPGSSGTDIETTVCAHCWQNTLPLVRTILRNGRSRRSIEDLFRRRLPLFPRQKFRRHRPRPSAR